MRGVNKAILVGNVGKDPEVKYTQGGLTITTVSLATTSVRKDKDGNTQEQTQWHTVKFFGKLGDIAGEYLKKGSQVYVEGEIRYNKFTGQDGVEKYFTEIAANEMQMLGGKPQEGGERTQGPRQTAQRRDPAPRTAQPASFDDVPFDDDIPF